MIAQCRAQKNVYTARIDLRTTNLVLRDLMNVSIIILKRGSRLPHNTSLSSASEGSTTLVLLTWRCTAHQLPPMKLAAESVLIVASPESTIC